MASAYCGRRRNIGPAVYNDSKRKRRRDENPQHRIVGPEVSLMPILMQNENLDENHDNENNDDQQRPSHSGLSNPIEQVSPGSENETRDHSGKILMFFIFIILEHSELTLEFTYLNQTLGLALGSFVILSRY